MNKQTKGLIKIEIAKLKKIIDDQKVEILQLKNIIDYLPGDVYCKRCVGKKLVYSGVNRTGIDSLHKMGFRWKIKDILGKTDDRLFEKETAETFIRNDWQVINEGVAVTKEEMAILPSGKKIINLSTKRPLLDKEGHIIGIEGVSINVTNYLLIPREGKFDFKNQRFYLGKTFGNEYLTSRELEVFRYILNGYALKKIAILLNISLLTTRWYVNSLRVKLQCRSKTEIMSVAIKHGLTYVLEEYKVWKNLKID